MSGAFPGNTKKGKKHGWCVVCRDQVFGYFAQLPPSAHSCFRSHDSEFPCCRACWDTVDDALDGASPRRKDRSTIEPTIARPSVPPKAPCPPCDVCAQKPGKREIKPGSPGFATANMMRNRILGKRYLDERIWLCRACGDDESAIRCIMTKVNKRAVLPPLVEEKLWRGCPEDASTNTPFISTKEIDTKEGKQEVSNTIPGDIRLLFAEMQRLGVTATACGPVYHLLCCTPKTPIVSRNTSVRTLIEFGHACLTRLARDVSGQRVALGCDGSSTYFERSAFEVHLSFDTWSSSGTELLGLCDQVDKTAAGYLKSILNMMCRLNSIQEKLGVRLTKLYHVDTLFADNASVNTGEIAGLVVLMNQARHMQYEADRAAHESLFVPEPFELYVPMEFKGCDDHILALVLTSFNRQLISWAAPIPEVKHLAWAKKQGGYVALPFHVLKKLSKRLGGFLAPAWHGARAAYDKVHPYPKEDKRPQIIKCSSNRFCTFGVTARGATHYLEAILPVCKPGTDGELRAWLMDDVVLFVCFLLSLYSVFFELPFLSGSHELGNTDWRAYEQFLEPWARKIDDMVANPSLLVSNYEQVTPHQQEITGLLLKSLKEVFDKHLACTAINLDGVLTTTNRWGETVFRHMRMVLDRQQKTRMPYVAALVAVKRSQYGATMTAKEMDACTGAARSYLDSPEVSYATYAHDRWQRLLTENAKADMNILVEARCNAILALLVHHKR